MSKRYKLMSLILIICICTSLLTPISTAYATETSIRLPEEIIITQGSDKADGIDHDDLEKLEDSQKREIIIPAEKLQERYNLQLHNPERDEYLERLSRIAKFSEASKEDLVQVAKYLNVIRKIRH